MLAISVGTIGRFYRHNLLICNIWRVAADTLFIFIEEMIHKLNRHERVSDRSRISKSKPSFPTLLCWGNRTNQLSSKKGIILWSALIYSALSWLYIVTDIVILSHTELATEFSALAMCIAESLEKALLISSNIRAALSTFAIKCAFWFSRNCYKPFLPINLGCGPIDYDYMLVCKSNLCLLLSLLAYTHHYPELTNIVPYLHVDFFSTSYKLQSSAHYFLLAALAAASKSYALHKS